MFFIKKKIGNRDVFERNCFVLESKLELSRYFGFNHPERIIEDDLDEEHYPEDINGRRRNDAEVLSLIAANTSNGCMLDIGTHLGRSAARMAVNGPKATVYTVNVHPDDFDKAGVLTTERLSLSQIGSFYREHHLSNIIQEYANTLNWNMPAYIHGISLLYVDGCHDAHAVYSDTKLTINRVLPGGFILWHDFSPIYRKNFHWIDACMKGIERLYDERILTGPIFNVKNSWIGIWKKPS